MIYVTDGLSRARGASEISPLGLALCDPGVLPLADCMGTPHGMHAPGQRVPGRRYLLSPSPTLPFGTMASTSNSLLWSSSLLGTLLLSGTASAQNFVDNQADIPSGSPFNNSRSENVDFGDVDQDGDWDAVFADGGDQDQDQNRIWINRGPGVNLGKFIDETSTRFPAINDQSRDIEFVDFDGDSDLDLYISNTSALIAQTNRWWTNTGVGSGNYVDETAARWVGLGGAGSSLAPNQVLAGGGFIDFSCDCDFGDLDNDGDMDLFHSSYGGTFGGQVPSRIYLNDGLGFFSEFNPSGFQLPGQLINNGDSGLWCEGTQQADTMNSDGTRCDIASSALDIDLGDIDGDFDLDVLHGARQEAPRMFVNRLEENGGTLGFRDVTGAVFPAGYTAGDGHYEQEMGDLDGDGDLDIYGLNWNAGFGFTDITLVNNGDGTFGGLTNLSGSSDDDNEGDFFDYDNDGDLDLYVANFSGSDRLYRNNNNGGTSFSFTQMSGMPATPFIALDADCCDVDGDGDYDVFVANDSGSRNQYLENLGGGTDVHAPYIPNLEQAPNRTPGAAPTVVRAQVYDNAPYYITWYNPTTLTYTVDGGAPTVVPMLSSGGQIFRGEIPGSLTGTIAYFVTSSDEYGNTGTSATRQYVGGSGGLGTAYCFGDGTGTACPCGNSAAAGEGCANSTGSGAIITASGSVSISAGNLVLSATGLIPSQPGLYFQGDNAVNGGNGIVFGDGLRCAGGGLIRLQVRMSDASGASSTTVNIAIQGGASAGRTTRYQVWYRDPGASPCGTGFNLSNGYELVWTP